MKNSGIAIFGLIFFGLLTIGVLSKTIQVEMRKPIETKITTSVIDSVWTKKPGEINTMQTDFIYYGRTKDGKIHRSIGTEFHVGDSIQYIYHRYENPKKEKKH